MSVVLLHFTFFCILCFNSYVLQVNDPSIAVDKDADPYLDVPRVEGEAFRERISTLSLKGAETMLLFHSLKAKNGHNFSLSQHKVRVQIPW